jgi:hypothetical protein
MPRSIRESLESQPLSGLVLDPLYTALGNQSRFDNVVSFNETFFNSVTGTQSPPTSFGSGVLISPNVVLTAAHVVDSPAAVLATGQNALTTQSSVGTFLATGSLGSTAVLSTQPFAILNYTVYCGSSAPGGNWNPVTQTGPDLAVVQVASLNGLQPITQFNRSGVLEPINFVPLYTGSSETTQPSPNFGIIAGYGNSGGGLTGEIRNTTGTKRAGLVLVDPTTQVIAGQTVLTSVFQNRSQLFSQGLPSNFLEGAVAHGDSGGGLFQSIGTGASLVQTGVISSTFGGLYGSQAQYTRVWTHSLIQ